MFLSGVGGSHRIEKLLDKKATISLPVVVFCRLRNVFNYWEAYSNPLRDYQFITTTRRGISVKWKQAN